MTTYKYQLNFKSFLKSFGFTLLLILGAYIYSIFRSENTDTLLKVLVVFLGPSFFLLFEYLYFSINTKIELTGNSLKIRGKIEVNYDYNDIEFVTLYCSNSYYSGSRRFLPSDEFYFLEVVMNDKRKLIITSLMINRKNNQFRINKTVEMLIASILWSDAV